MISPSGLRQARFRAADSASHLLLVRHGESELAAAAGDWRMVMGHADPRLHPHGRAQAERVADRLVGEALAAVYVTPLTRTHETAAPLLRRLGMEPRVEPDLREVHLGGWEGARARQYFAEGHPVARRIMDEERWDLPPGAEPDEEFRQRITAAVARIAARHPGEVVAVFSHGGVIGRILAEAAGSRPFAFTTPDNASISHLVVHGDRWTVRCFNDTAHLSERFVDVPELPWDTDVAPSTTTGGNRQ